MAVFIRILITLALLAWLVTKIDLTHVGQVLTHAHPGWVLAAILAYLLVTLGLCWRWRILLRDSSPTVSYAHLCWLTYLSAFFGLFLPGTISGDIVKITLASPTQLERHHVISSVLVDRLLGLGVTLLVGLVALLCWPVARNEMHLLPSIILVIGGFLLVIVLLFNERLARFLSRLVPASLWSRLRGLIARTYRTLLEYQRSPKTLLLAVLASLCVQSLNILSVWCAGMAVGIHLDLFSYFAIIPVVLIITAIPISINGLGLQDNAFVVFLHALAVPASPALALSLFVHVTHYCVGLIGGILFTLWRGESPFKSLGSFKELLKDKAPLPAAVTEGE